MDQDRANNHVLGTCFKGRGEAMEDGAAESIRMDEPMRLRLRPTRQRSYSREVEAADPTPTTSEPVGEAAASLQACNFFSHATARKNTLRKASCIMN